MSLCVSLLVTAVSRQIKFESINNFYNIIWFITPEGSKTYNKADKNTQLNIMEEHGG